MVKSVRMPSPEQLHRIAEFRRIRLLGAMSLLTCTLAGSCSPVWDDEYGEVPLFIKFGVDVERFMEILSDESDSQKPPTKPATKRPPADIDIDDLDTDDGAPDEPSADEPSADEAPVKVLECRYDCVRT